MTSLLFLTQKTICKRQSIYYSISKEYNLEIATKKDEGIWFRWGRSLKYKNYYKR